MGSTVTSQLSPTLLKGSAGPVLLLQLLDGGCSAVGGEPLELVAEFTCPRKTQTALNLLQSCFSSESSPQPIKSHPIPLETEVSSVLTGQVKQGMVLPNWEALSLDWLCWEGFLGCSHIYLHWNPGCCQPQRQRLARIYAPGVPSHLQREHTVPWDCCEGMAGEQPGCWEKLG